MKDLIVLVADLDTEIAFREILQRTEALGIRKIDATFRRHPGRDSSCLLDAHEFLRSFHNQFLRCLVAFDKDGCGQETQSREQLENRVESLLEINGWRQRSAALVLDPELEVWVWSESPHVSKALGFSNLNETKRFLQEKGFDLDQRSKPLRPKEAMREALKKNQKRPSAAIFGQLAKAVSLRNCQDPAFEKLKRVLGEWFPA
jgi:hypothetical protein